MPKGTRGSQSTDSATDWNEVIAKALAYLVVNSAGLKDKKVTEKATFLMGMGLARKDAAAALGSTDESLRVNLGKQGTKTAKGRGRARKQR
jgi:hypothetical protein